MIRQRKSTSGFTIIELLIVLAIAGLILVIVFLAVPKFRMDARNNQRRRDVANVLGAINEFASVYSGSRPTDMTFSTTSRAVIFNESLSDQMEIPTSIYGLGTSGSASLDYGDQTNTTDVDSLLLVIGAKCSGANAVSSENSAVLLYSVETLGGSIVQQCYGT